MDQDTYISGNPTQGNTDAGDTGEAGTTWFDSLPDDVRSNEAAAGWKDKAPGDLLKAHLDLEGKLKSALVVPGDNATPEQWAEFDAKMRSFMGVPEKAEGYKLSMPEGVPADDPIVGALVQQAHVQGLNNAQLNGILGNMTKAIAEYNEAQKMVNQEAVKGLWGAKYEERINRAILGMEKAGASAQLTAEEISDLAKQLPYHPHIVRIMDEVGRLYSEDFVSGGQVVPGKEMGKTAGGTPQLEFPSMQK